MNNRNWVEKMIWSIILLNIFVLAGVFLIPRAQFMIGNWGMESGAIMETAGAEDTPNQYSKTYRMVNNIRKVLAEDSIIFIPEDNKELGTNRSVVIQRLYPRKIFFLGDPKAEKVISKVSNFTNAYMILNENQGLCIERSVKSFLSEGFVICRMTEK